MRETSLSELIETGVLSNLQHGFGLTYYDYSLPGSNIMSTSQHLSISSKHIAHIDDTTQYRTTIRYQDVFYTSHTGLLMQVSSAQLLPAYPIFNRTYDFLRMSDTSDYRLQVHVHQDFYTEEWCELRNEWCLIKHNIDPTSRGLYDYPSKTESAQYLLQTCIDYVNLEDPYQFKVANAHEILKTMMHLDVFPWSIPLNNSITCKDGKIYMKKSVDSHTFEELIDEFEEQCGLLQVSNAMYSNIQEHEFTGGVEEFKTTEEHDIC